MPRRARVHHWSYKRDDVWREANTLAPAGVGPPPPTGPYSISMLHRRDIYLLFATRCTRMFAYGLLSVVFAIYLKAVGLTPEEIGLLMALTLAGDTAISLWLTTQADRFGRRRTLIVGAGLMVLAGVVFLATGNFLLLVIAATIGVISPGGNEIGPFLSVEQAALSHVIVADKRTDVFAWYNLVGSFATAFGALAGGWLAESMVSLQRAEAVSWLPIDDPAAVFRPVLLAYAAIGVALAFGFAFVSPAVEVTAMETGSTKSRWGLHESRGVVMKLSALFALDAFGGGFVIQTLIALWFQSRFGLDPKMLGTVFFFANLFAGISALAAGWLARRIGLVNTMVFTHLPSNVLLIFVPLMPDATTAIAVLLARFSISQMDVPTRQAYTLLVVRPDERSAAAGVTAVARSIGAAISPLFASPLFGIAALASLPFFIAGGCKIVYDLLLWRAFARTDHDAAAKS
jgi:MFS family permease